MAIRITLERRRKEKQLITEISKTHENISLINDKSSEKVPVELGLWCVSQQFES